MTDHQPPDDSSQRSDPAVDDLSAMLAEPDVWEVFDPADEAAILAAISSEVERGAVSAGPVVAPVAGELEGASISAISSARRWLGPVVAGIAAAVVVLVGASVLTGSDAGGGNEFALAATELAPGAEGAITIADTANGTRIILDVSGLAPAPAGSYYEAWVRKDADVGVSAGTFHLRGGGGEIELWAGVTTEDYPLFTVTIQDEASPASSGRVVLRGRLDE